MRAKFVSECLNEDEELDAMYHASEKHNFPEETSASRVVSPEEKDIHDKTYGMGKYSTRKDDAYTHEIKWQQKANDVYYFIAGKMKFLIYKAERPAETFILNMNGKPIIKGTLAVCKAAVSDKLKTDLVEDILKTISVYHNEKNYLHSLSIPELQNILGSYNEANDDKVWQYARLLGNRHLTSGLPKKWR